MSHLEKKHYYLFSYHWTGDLNGEFIEGHGSDVFTRSPSKTITKKDLDIINLTSKTRLREKGITNSNITILSISYLGEMSVQEFEK